MGGSGLGTGCGLVGTTGRGGVGLQCAIGFLLFLGWLCSQSSAIIAAVDNGADHRFCSKSPSTTPTAKLSRHAVFEGLKLSELTTSPDAVAKKPPKPSPSLLLAVLPSPQFLKRPR